MEKLKRFQRKSAKLHRGKKTEIVTAQVSDYESPRSTQEIPDAHAKGKLHIEIAKEGKEMNIVWLGRKRTTITGL